MLDILMPTITTTVPLWLLRSTVRAYWRTAQSLIRIQGLETQIKLLEAENLRLQRALGAAKAQH